jgi:hypothetical protein
MTFLFISSDVNHKTKSASVIKCPRKKVLPRKQYKKTCGALMIGNQKLGFWEN